MNDQHDVLTTLAEHLVLAFKPLEEAFSDEERFKGFLFSLGWEVDDLPQEYIELSAQVSAAVATVKDLANKQIEADDIANLVATVKNLFQKTQNLSTAPAGVNSAEFLGEIGERLGEYLLTEYLSRNVNALYNLLAALDVIEIENLGDTANKNANIRTKIKWSEIPKILENPLSIAKGVYGWGTDNLNSRNIFNHISGLMFSLGFPVNLIKPDEFLALEYSGAEELQFSRKVSGLRIPFHYNYIGDIPIELSIDILELPKGNGNHPGLVIQPNIPSELPFDFDLGDEVSLKIKVGSDIGSKFGVLITPEGIDVKYPFQDSASFPSAGFGATIDYHPADPKVLFGSPEGIRMEMKGGSLGLEAFSESGEFEVRGLSELKELSLILTAGNGDGFLQKILGDGEKKIDVSLGIDWSSKMGFGFRGSMSFEISMNPHISLGIIEIPQFQLSLKVPSGTEPRIDLESTINVKGDLGPLKVVVEEIGLGLYTKFESGNLGPLDLNLGFKPPNGVGLSVNAEVIKGGGYLFFDHDREEYAGALELVFSEWIALKAIGIVTTKMPDGSKGFSMLIIITAEFGTGIQLGFGFTLIGVGGLLGLNRTVKLQPLVEGVRTGAVKSVMFPQNVVANAPKIISDLKQFFPVEDGDFLIGPMAKIGWGTPTLVSVSLGIILELPDVNITILGVLKVALPDEDADILRLQVNFMGRFEPSNKLLWFYAELFESRVLFITLEGGMGLLVNWSDNSNFVISVGGFHPRFNPPPLPFPAPPRIAASLLDTSVAKVRIEGYFAVTSNTAQFGAKVEAMFGFSFAKAEGHLSFDALFQFDPFYFIFEFSVGFSVKVFGFGCFSFRVEGLFEGPAKWHIKGYAKKKLTCIGPTIKIPIDKTWGEERQTELPPIQIIPLMEKEMAAITNWTAILPAGSNILVTLRKLDEPETGSANTTETDSRPLVLHPVGTLRISQRKIPLNLVLNKLGNQRPSDANKLSIEPTNTGVGGFKHELVKEKFATGEYKDLDKSKKLSSPGFEPYDGGIELKANGSQLKTSMAVKKDILYETIIIDNNYKRYRFKFFQATMMVFTTLYATLFSHFLKGNMVTKSTLSKNYRSQILPNPKVIKIKPEKYSVAYIETNAPINENAKQFTSQAEAMDFLKEQIGNNAHAAQQMHIIPNTEIATAI